MKKNTLILSATILSIVAGGIAVAQSSPTADGAVSEVAQTAAADTDDRAKGKRHWNGKKDRDCEWGKRDRRRHDHGNDDDTATENG